MPRPRRRRARPGPANDVLELDSGVLAAARRGLRAAGRSRGRAYPCRPRLRRPRLTPLRLDVFTLVPHAFAWLTEQRPLAAVLGGELDLRLFSYRDTTPLRAGQVDDEPYGGGAGMVLRVDVVAAALDAAYGGAPAHRVIALTPQGRPLTQEVVEELAKEEHADAALRPLRGLRRADRRAPLHRRDLDRPLRPLERRPAGDGARSTRSPGGCPARSPRARASSRASPTELGGGLEYPHYTRPPEFRGWRVPDVLLSGDHGRIERWRKEHVR